MSVQESVAQKAYYGGIFVIDYSWMVSHIYKEMKFKAVYLGNFRFVDNKSEKKKKKKKKKKKRKKR